MSRELVVLSKHDDIYERFINHAVREVEMSTANVAMARMIGGGGVGLLESHSNGYKNKRVTTAAGRLESFCWTVQLSAPTATLVYMLLAHRDVGAMTKISAFALLVLQILMVLDHYRSVSEIAAPHHSMGRNVAAAVSNSAKAFRLDRE